MFSDRFTYFTDKLITVLPSTASHLLIQSMAGALGGFTTTIITNPLDIIRARLQVSVQNHQRLHIGDYLRVKLLRFFFGPNIFEMCLLYYQNTTS